MANLNVVYMNHLDLTWRRPRYTADRVGSYLVAPYAEIQERQLDRARDFMQDGGVYTLEQTISLREYLERNPDAVEEIRQRIADGHLRIVGGGEAVTDTNLPDGESLIRNHLYSRLWLRKEFEYEPQLAAVPDAFGLSAGLPGLFRQLGYRGILQFSRVFGGRKTYWRGLSGDIIALATASEIPGFKIHFADFRKSRVCTVCGGEGCIVCRMRGAEAVSVPKKTVDILALENQIRTIAQDEDVTIYFEGEENRVPDGTVEALRILAENCGRTLCFLCPEDEAVERCRELLAHTECPDENEIDSRLEGNPVATGCYTTRIRLKQENRRCESSLRNAERLAALASLRGVPYPAKTFAYWWRKLAFVHFHDALPASHSDGAYHELMEICRSLRAAVFRVTERSAGKLLEGLMAEVGPGEPFAVLNPLEFDVKNAVLKAGVHLRKDMQNGRVIGPDGRECPVLSVICDKAADIERAEVTFLGSVPAMGYAVYRFIPEEIAPIMEVPMPHGCVIENEHLRVTFTPYSVKSIYDKDMDRVIAVEGTFSPLLSDDAGHLWGRTNPVQYEDRADLDTYWENMFPAAQFSRTLTVENREGLSIARLRIVFSRPERGTNLLVWTAEFLLPAGSSELQVRITTTFDAHDVKLSTAVFLPTIPKNGELHYEIPLGEIARGPVNELNPELGYADEWPALRYVTAKLDEMEITLCNNGTAGHSIDGSRIQVSLLRTPTQLGCGWGIDEAVDREIHTFCFTLAANRTSAELDGYRRGMILNTEFPSIPLDSAPLSDSPPVPHTGCFMRLPDNLPLLAMKGAEDGNGLILRYLGRAESETLHFENPVSPCGILEDNGETAVRDVSVGVYQIRTLRMMY